MLHRAIETAGVNGHVGPGTRSIVEVAQKPHFPKARMYLISGARNLRIPLPTNRCLWAALRTSAMPGTDTDLSD